MKKFLTLGIAGITTLIGFSASALADDCVTEAAPTTYYYEYQQPVNVEPVAAPYRQSWRERRAAELRRIEAQRVADELRRQAELQAAIEARRAEHHRRMELARYERLRREQFRFGRIAHHRWSR